MSAGSGPGGDRPGADRPGPDALDLTGPQATDAAPVVGSAAMPDTPMVVLRELLLASRPLSWVNTALPFLAAAYEVERGLTPLVVIGTLYFLVPYNLLMYGINDIFDYASDLANPRKRSLEGGLVPPDRRRVTWLAIAVSNLPFLALLVILAPPAGWLAVLLAAAAAVAYSAPPLRTKVRPILDSATSASHFVLPAAAGFLVTGVAVADLPWDLLVAFFAWGMASHALGAIQDIEYDRAAGIGSVGTALGARTTAWLALVGYGLAVALAIPVGGPALVAAAALATYLLLPLAVLFDPSEAQARRAWRSFLGLNLLVGFVLTQLLLIRWGIVPGRPDDLVVGAAFVGAGACLAMLLANVVTLRHSRRTGLAGHDPSAPLPRLAIVVPCRDEAANLRAGLAALARQDHPDLRIVVVDDDSRDDSAVVARHELERLGLAPERGRVIDAGPRPDGWAGKAWACSRGLAATEADHVLFLDADTVVAPHAARTLHRIALGTGAGLVSGVSAYAMPTAAERAFVPGFPMTILGWLPLWAHVLFGGRSRRLAFAYGPLLLVERGAYTESGGHAAIPGSQREDLDLAKTMARSGREVRLVAAADLAATRHYARGTDALRAWRRVTLAYVGDTLTGVIATVLVSATCWLLPFVALPVAAASGRPDLVALAALALTLLLAFRVGLAIVERQPLRSVLWHPVTIGATIAAQLVSLVDGICGVPAIWRGRPYEARKS